MTWIFTTDVGAYDAAAGALLRSDAERNTIGVTVLDQAVRRTTPLDPPELYAWWRTERGDVTGAASITPPWPILLDCVPEVALQPLAEKLVAEAVAVVGVNGPNTTAATFAGIWRRLTADRVLLHDALRLFRLERLEPPSRSVGGHCRTATETDVPLLVDWFIQFGAEVHGPMPRVEAAVRERLEHGGLSLWEDQGGRPVSMAGHTHPVEGVVRVGPVFTPVDSRGMGYAEAVTHAVSADVVDRGLRAVLFTDQSNPTSNGIYTRLGYRPVMDRMMLRFEPAGT